MRDQKGFTLIELIMVIVILGILAAVVVPRFFDFTTDAHKASVEAFVGNIKSALEMSSAETTVDNGYKAYPKANTITDFSDLLDQVPSEWAVASVNANNVDFVYSGDSNFANGVKVRYHCTGDDSYTLKLKTAAYGWALNYEF